MFDPLLPTRLYRPAVRPDWVARPRLLARLDAPPPTRLILISAPAGYGKTTLVATWLQQQDGRHVCWLSLDEEDGDPHTFFRYLAAAIRPLPGAQESLSRLLQSGQPLPAKTLLKGLLQDVTAVADPFLLVLDDYHALDAAEIDGALATLLDHMPPQMTLLLTTRADPNLPLSRLRARGQLVELRAGDLRFTTEEAAQFLRQTMGLALTPAQIDALEQRTEGWIAGLQLAALSMQQRDGEELERFVSSFTGSHRFVLDYLVEEVLARQPEEIRTFLLATAILDRLSGPLCTAVTGRPDAQTILEGLERHNLFVVPLDETRQWYRYHHLFAELLRQRLQQAQGLQVDQLHQQASQWYEAHGLPLAAFHHAAAAGDVDRAAQLAQGDGMPLHFQGAAGPVLTWLAALPAAELDARPALRVTYASALLLTGDPGGRVAELLQTAEAALPQAGAHESADDLAGQIAALRAMLAVPQHQTEAIIAHARRALALLHPDNLPVRTSMMWTLGFAHHVRGERAAARQAYGEALAAAQASGNKIMAVAALTGLGQIAEAEIQLPAAAEHYGQVLPLVGEPPWPTACEALLGLARIQLEWNDLAAAQRLGRQSVELAQQLENVDTPAPGAVLLARVALAQGDAAAALERLAQGERFVRQHHFLHWLPAVTAVQVEALLQQGNLTAAAELAAAHDLPGSRARVHLAAGEAAAALDALAAWRQQVERNDQPAERLQLSVLQAVAHEANGEREAALSRLAEALALAAPGRFVRLFVAEGAPIAALLRAAAAQGIAPAYGRQLLAALGEATETAVADQPLPEPLSERELEVLRLLGSELSGPEIARELVISLNTLRTHTKNIYAKLGVNSRRAAVRRAVELALL